MTTMQKTGEPSMEEILASIRKIIADDPSAPTAKPSGAPAFPAPTLQVATPAKPSVPVDRGAPSSLERELADLLSDPVEIPPAAKPVPLAPTLPTVTAQPTPTQPTPTPATRPTDAGSSIGTWLRGKVMSGAAAPTPSPTPVPAPIPTPMPSAIAEPVRVEIAQPKIEVTPAPQPAAEVIVPVDSAAIPRSPTTAQAIAAVTAEPALALQPPKAEPSAVPMAMETPPQAASGMNGNRSSSTMQSILGRLSASAAAAAGAASSSPMPAPVKSRAFPASPRPAEIDTAPEVTAPANRVAEEAKTAEPMLPAVAAQATVVAAALERQPADESATPAEAKVPLAAAPQSVEARPEPAAPVAQVAAPVVEAAPAPRVAASSATASSPSLDDKLAELLRPMVRQWLDDNMLRALEKAVSAEVAEGALAVMDKLGTTKKS